MGALGAGHPAGLSECSLVVLPPRRRDHVGEARRAHLCLEWAYLYEYIVPAHPTGGRERRDGSHEEHSSLWARYLWCHAAMTAADSSERMDDLASRLASVELELAMVRASVEERLRTRRLAVVDERGIERIVLDARHGTGSVLVRVHGPDGHTTGVEVYASQADDGGHEVGLCVLRDGDVVSRWTAG